MLSLHSVSFSEEYGISPVIAGHRDRNLLLSLYEVISIEKILLLDQFRLKALMTLLMRFK